MWGSSIWGEVGESLDHFQPLLAPELASVLSLAGAASLHRSYRPHSDTLAGATTPLDQCVRNFFHEATDSSDLPAALSAVTSNPARVLNLFPTRGSLQPGALADLVFLDRGSLSVMCTWLAGVPAFLAESVSFRVRLL